MLSRGCASAQGRAGPGSWIGDLRRRGGAGCALWTRSVATLLALARDAPCGICLHAGSRHSKLACAVAITRRLTWNWCNQVELARIHFASELRSRAWEEVKKPQRRAFIISMIDGSGSMGEGAEVPGVVAGVLD